MALALTVLGIIVAGYLAGLHFTGSSALCAGVWGCGDEQYSIQADIGKMPVALIGLLGYLAILGTLLLERWWSTISGDNVSLWLFGLTLIGMIFSAYLTYLELFVIYALCPYCMAPAVIMVALLAISISRLMPTLKEDASL